MGGTLPVLAAWLQKNTPDAARRSARFYSVNSFGAVLGAGLSGFVLVQWLGLQGTMVATACVNVIIGLSVLAIARIQRKPMTSDAEVGSKEQPTLEPAPKVCPRFVWSYLVVAITGAVSMGLEVLATRCLALVFGASLQVFAIVLMAFILGIGLGSAWIASPGRTQWRKETTTALLLAGAAAFIALLIANIENLVQIYLYAQSGLDRTSMGYCYHQLMLSVISIGVLGVPAAAIGSVLPLWIRELSDPSDPLGELVGRLLTWNTIGAMTGALITGFVLMPNIGLRGSFAVLASILVVGAFLTALTIRQVPMALLTGATGVFLTVVTFQGGEGWRYILSSGMFRVQVKSPTRDWMAERLADNNLLFYEDGADATVSVEEGPSPFSPDEITLRINGKADASSVGDISTQILLAQLPLMAKPGSKDVFCFGMGSGVTAGSSLGYPIDHLTVAENCEPVLRAAKFFAAENGGVLTNSRLRICEEDARTVLKLETQKYDAIIAEPSNPWTVGIGSVFSRDFYQIAASRLKPGGIMAQWFHIYDIDDDMVKLVLRTFASTFPSMEVWDVDGGDIVLLGSVETWKSGPDVFRSAFELERPRRDLAAAGVRTPEAMLARQLASQRTAFAIPGPGPIQTDDHPILEYDAPRAFYLHLGETVTLFQHFDERTSQMELASPEKNRVLTQLDAASLFSVFGRYSSVNTELTAYASMRAGVTAASQYLLSMPCVFRGTNQMLLFAPEAARTNEAVRELVEAEAVFRSDTTNQAPAIEVVKSVLGATRDYKPNVAGWSAAHYGGLAVKACLRLGNREEAKVILSRSIEMEPDSVELAYLSRIMTRDGALQGSGDAGSSVPRR
jgi:predicted membrane-bound spermidine synthase